VVVEVLGIFGFGLVLIDGDEVFISQPQAECVVL